MSRRKAPAPLLPLLCLLCGHPTHAGGMCGAPALGQIPWVCRCMSVPPRRYNPTPDPTPTPGDRP